MTASRQQAVVKAGFQSRVVQHLVAAEPYNHEDVLRTKMSRFKILGVPAGILSRRATRRIAHAFEIVPARVAIVLFRTWLNGWCTARRFQQKGVSCLFGCQCPSIHDCIDSIEHYAICPVVQQFARQSLHLPDELVGNMLGFMCLSRNTDDGILILQLLLVYAVYSATNCLRFAKPHLASNTLHEFLLQFVHQGASQSSLAQSAVHEHVTMSRATRRQRRQALYLSTW